MEKIFVQRSQREWCDLLEGTDVCFAPVLRMVDAADHPHNFERGTFVEVNGIRQPSPAPRFSRTPGSVRHAPVEPGHHSREILADLGRTPDDIRTLVEDGVVVAADGDDSEREQ
jgi:alpha-methylacyl-CoA racemase